MMITMPSTYVPEPAREVSPSARLVYLALREEGPLTVDEIISWTGTPKRTVKDTISRLREHDLITSWPHPDNNRKKVYSVACEDSVAEQQHRRRPSM